MPPSPTLTAPGRHGRGRRFTPLVLLAVAALAIGGIAALASGGDDKPASGDKSAGTATQAQDGAKPSPKTKSTPQPASKPPATTTPPASSGESPAALDTRGYDLIKQGKYQQAVPLEEQAVAGFRGRGDRSSTGYAFALFNLGTALNRSGRPSEAIPYLEERLRISDDRPEIVEKELTAARAAVGDSAKPGKKPNQQNGDDDKE